MGCFGEWRCGESWVRIGHAAGSRAEMQVAGQPEETESGG